MYTCADNVWVQSEMDTLAAFFQQEVYTVYKCISVYSIVHVTYDLYVHVYVMCVCCVYCDALSLRW